MRIVLAIVAGLVVAVFCVAGLEMLGHMVFPPPADLDASDPADVARMMEVIPAGALLFVVVAWFVGALAGAWTANATARRAMAGWIVAGFIVLGAVVTMVMIPHPAWMWACGILLPVLAAWIAGKAARVAA
jgi:hypothetical protein